MVVVDVYNSLPDRPQAVPASGRKMLSMVSYGRKRPFADIANIFEGIGILMEVKNWDIKGVSNYIHYTSSFQCPNSKSEVIWQIKFIT